MRLFVLAVVVSPALAAAIARRADLDATVDGRGAAHVHARFEEQEQMRAEEQGSAAGGGPHYRCNEFSATTNRSGTSEQACNAGTAEGAWPPGTLSNECTWHSGWAMGGTCRRDFTNELQVDWLNERVAEIRKSLDQVGRELMAQVEPNDVLPAMAEACSVCRNEVDRLLKNVIDGAGSAAGLLTHASPLGQRLMQVFRGQMAVPSALDSRATTEVNAQFALLRRAEYWVQAHEDPKAQVCADLRLCSLDDHPLLSAAGEWLNKLKCIEHKRWLREPDAPRVNFAAERHEVLAAGPRSDSCKSLERKTGECWGYGLSDHQIDVLAGTTVDCAECGDVQLFSQRKIAKFEDEMYTAIFDMRDSFADYEKLWVFADTRLTASVLKTVGFIGKVFSRHRTAFDSSLFANTGGKSPPARVKALLKTEIDEFTRRGGFDALFRGSAALETVLRTALDEALHDSTYHPAEFLRDVGVAIGKLGNTTDTAERRAKWRGERRVERRGGFAGAEVVLTVMDATAATRLTSDTVAGSLSCRVDLGDAPKLACDGTTETLAVEQPLEQITRPGMTGEDGSLFAHDVTVPLLWRGKRHGELDVAVQWDARLEQLEVTCQRARGLRDTRTFLAQKPYCAVSVRSMDHVVARRGASNVAKKHRVDWTNPQPLKFQNWIACEYEQPLRDAGCTEALAGALRNCTKPEHLQGCPCQCENEDRVALKQQARGAPDYDEHSPLAHDHGDSPLAHEHSPLAHDRERAPLASLRTPPRAPPVVTSDSSVLGIPSSGPPRMSPRSHSGSHSSVLGIPSSGPPRMSPRSHSGSTAALLEAGGGSAVALAGAAGSALEQQSIGGLILSGGGYGSVSTICILIAIFGDTMDYIFWCMIWPAMIAKD